MRLRQHLGSLKHRKGLLLKRLIVLGSCVLLIYVVLTSSTRATSTSRLLDDNAKQELASESVGRSAQTISPFHWVEKRRRKALKKAATINSPFAGLWKLLSLNNKGADDPELQLLVNWETAPLAERCRYMIDATYAINQGWSNNMIVDSKGSDEIDNVLVSLMGESLRLFDHCFISGRLSMGKVFEVKSLIDPDNGTGSSPEDYVRRVFPFLSQKNGPGNDPMWPDITNLRTGEREPVPQLPREFNRDFWLSWQTMAKGKGIVITLNEASKHLFFKQLKVLEHNGNRLPIQIITSGGEFSAVLIDELQEKVKLSDQQVSLVDCSPILDNSFAKKNIRNVINKWLAVIYNTFEEAVLLDVDAVPFVPVESFLSDKSYKESGILMYKDRYMPNERTFRHCTDMLREAEPSMQERSLIKSKIKYHSGVTNFDNSEEAAVYQRFTHDLLLHHVDSGLVVINKVRNLNGLLFSFMLNLDAKMKLCVYGDKEMFWLGQLYAGQDYTIYPMDGGIVGPVTKAIESDSAVYRICATQISHCDISQNLLWTNGGLKTCKLSGGADLDFQNDPEYFEARYSDVATLKGIYNAPLRLEGMIVPDPREPWNQLRECSSYIYCASANEEVSTANSRESIIGHILIFDEATLRRHSSVVSMWNQS